jgi:hypothetical protein
MRKVALLATSFALLIIFLLLPNTKAHAQIDAFLSASGIGTTCSITSPCSSVSAAISAVMTGGTIYCLGTGEYFANSATINKTLTIDCPGSSIEAGIADGLVINGAGIIVRLRNFSLHGFGALSSGEGSIGINFVNGGALHVENVDISGVGQSPAIGIKFAPTTAAKLYVSNSSISDSGTGTVGGGIVVSPSGSGSARVIVERTTITNNVFGIAVDGSGSTGGINMTVTDSVTSGNTQDGIIATTPGGGAPIGIMVKNSKSVNNAFGIRSLGPNVTVRASNSTIIGNSTGLSFSGGGALLTFGNNEVQANGTNGAFSGPVGLQ